MVIHHIRKHTNFIFFYSGVCCNEYLATTASAEQVDNLFDSFNGGTRVDQGKTLRCPLRDNTPHIEHWKKANMGINSWIFLKNNKPAFLRPPHNAARMFGGQ
jgi:hypothetical protein